MRVTLDTNVLVRAHAHASGPARELIAPGPDVLVVSAFILQEVERVLNYPRLRAQWSLTQEEIQEIVAELDRIAELVEVPPEAAASVVKHDPDDDPIVQTAVVGQVGVLCTLDRHLRRDPDVQSYCATHGIEILSDVELLKRLRGGP